jgi:hypothetical protein
VGRDGAGSRFDLGQARRNIFLQLGLDSHPGDLLVGLLAAAGVSIPCSRGAIAFPGSFLRGWLWRWAVSGSGQKTKLVAESVKPMLPHQFWGRDQDRAQRLNASSLAQVGECRVCLPFRAYSTIAPSQIRCRAFVPILSTRTTRITGETPVSFFRAERRLSVEICSNLTAREAYRSAPPTGRCIFPTT